MYDIGARPSVGDPVTGDKGIVLDADRCPECLAVVVVDTVVKINDYALYRVAREGVGVYACTLCGGKAGAYAIVGEGDFVESGFGMFCVVAETRAVA